LSYPTFGGGGASLGAAAGAGAGAVVSTVGVVGTRGGSTVVGAGAGCAMADPARAAQDRIVRDLRIFFARDSHAVTSP
jgi:hypothetical protein